MRNLIKLFWQTSKVFILFVGFTILFYFAIVWFNEEYENLHRYDEPKGTAVKVFQSINDEEEPGWRERLFLFYLDGE